MPAKPKRQLDMVTSKQFQGGKAEIDPELKKQLEALGYMGGGIGK